MILDMAQYTYALVFLETYMSILILIFLLSMFLGMREVSAALSNPFSDDDVDLPMSEMIRDLRKLISPLVQEETLESRLVPPHLAATIADDAVRRRRRRRRRAAPPPTARAPRAAFQRRRACSSSARSPRTLPASAGGACSSCPATPLRPARTLRRCTSRRHRRVPAAASAAPSISARSRST